MGAWTTANGSTNNWLRSLVDGRLGKDMTSAMLSLLSDSSKLFGQHVPIYLSRYTFYVVLFLKFHYGLYDSKLPINYQYQGNQFCLITVGH